MFIILLVSGNLQNGKDATYYKNNKNLLLSPWFYLFLQSLFYLKYFENYARGAVVRNRKFEKETTGKTDKKHVRIAKETLDKKAT